MQTSRAGRASHVARGSRLGWLSSPALIGRDAELGELTLILGDPPALAVVEGEAGVGKTRLVREVLTRPEFRGRRVLVGHCQPLREPLPFGPVIEALRGAQDVALTRELGPIAGALRPLIPELSQQLPPALEPLGDARAERHRVFRAILELLSALGPTICVLEDLHWSDEGTGDLLRFLVSQLPEELCLVLTYRREDLPRSSGVLGLTSRLPAHAVFTRLFLSPLGHEDMRKLVSSILRVEDVSEEFALHLHERTLGLPFAVEEVLRLLADRRDLVQRGGRWARRMLNGLEVPAATRDSILERFARLSPDARRTVQAAAAVGVAAPEAVLRSVAGLSRERAARGLSEALSLSLLRETEDGRLDLRHALARQAVYEAIETPERRRFHLRAAQVLERGDEPLPLAQVANHFKRADMPNRWVRYAEAAADLAISLGNESAACELLAEALTCSQASTTARARMAIKLGRAALGGLDHGQALPVLRHVLEEALPTGVRGEIRLYVGLLLDNQAGQASAGLAEIARAVTELRRRPGLAARAMSVLAVPMSMEGHLAEHLTWMNRATVAAHRARDPVLRTAVLVNRATLLTHVGDPGVWRAILDVPHDAASAGERRQLLRANANLAHACIWIGHYGHAESFLTRALEILTEASDPYFALSLEATSVLLDWSRGLWAGLEDRARRLSNAADDVPLVFAEAELVLGLLMLARGELVEAKAHLGSAREVAATGGSVPVVVAAAGGIARLLLARREAHEAAEEALGALDLVRRKGIWVWATEIAPIATEALLASGRKTDAVQLVAEVGKGLRGRDAPAAHAALNVCRALLLSAGGRAEQAARSFARAERAWLDLPRPYESARCREARSVSLLSVGQPRGKDLLLGALDAFKALDAAWDAARVRRSLRAHGVVRPWRGGRRGYGSQLSPREEEVVRLAATGRTNREIAEALVLSPRTVEEHLAKAMRKLGVGSRRALT
jgi:DNA-binding CsgD family transcriptional regulator